MERYDEFMTEVGENYSTYTVEDWAAATEEFDKYSGEWFNKFSDELSFREKMVLAAYQVKYAYYYSLSGVKDVVNGIVEDEQLQAWKNEAKEYIEGDMSDDLQSLVDELKKAGVEAETFIRDIADELEDDGEDIEEMLNEAAGKLEEQFNQ